MSTQVKSTEDIRKYITGGKSVFTLVNTLTGGRFTYKVSCNRDYKALGANPISPFFVNVLVGPDNTRDYKYIGLLGAQAENSYVPFRAKDGLNTKAQKGFSWFWRAVNGKLNKGFDSFPHVQIWHDGKCGRCRRTLTVPESIGSGFGPVCVGLV